jgi:hypothetical protein
MFKVSNLMSAVALAAFFASATSTISVAKPTDPLPPGAQACNTPALLHNPHCQQNNSNHRSTSRAGVWAVGCGIASAGSLMIGTAIHAGDKKDPRQLTINEAGWHSAACPFLLPWALIVQATCPDNKATYHVARLAFRYVKKHGPGDQSAFTNAYGEACRTGKLTRETRRLLNRLI